ncbi:septal ring lytic transglycosylase RlpA family protein [Pseudomaricurvus sp.]|uniref:septal ring lytic transglycosylase RlpA family protein n=1 Tax=Pseudomaricurvus sp. TaxID=2004510 RepID=UPI003F6A6E3F
MGSLVDQASVTPASQPQYRAVLLFMALGMLFLSACSTQKPVVQKPRSDSSQIIVNVPTDVKDSGPAQDVDVSHIPDAVPRKEVRTRAGNKSPYKVLGKTYRVLPTDKDFVQVGRASWYGNKFHGKRTANGELYSMYGMTAAHKTLPIPSYVKVTNLANGREVIVRINDRGPFHKGRVIDLSYAAASKLGYLKQGTAEVRVEAIQPLDKVAVSHPAAPQLPVAKGAARTDLPKAPAPQNSAGFALPDNTFLQAGAFSTPAAAENLRNQLGELTTLPVKVIPPSEDALYRVQVGPIGDNLVLMDLRSLLEKNRLPSPHLVYD